MLSTTAVVVPRYSFRNPRIYEAYDPQHEEEYTYYTPIMAAIARGCDGALRRLVTKMCQSEPDRNRLRETIDRCNSRGLNALYLACLHSNLTAIGLLVQRMDADMFKTFPFQGHSMSLSTTTTPLQTFVSTFQRPVATLSEQQNILAIFNHLLTRSTTTLTRDDLFHIISPNDLFRHVFLNEAMISYPSPPSSPPPPATSLPPPSPSFSPVPPPKKKYLETLPREFICSVCANPFDDPVLTSVGNVYCKACLNIDATTNPVDPILGITISKKIFNAGFIQRLMNDYITS